MPEANEADLESRRRRAYEAAAGVRDPEVPALTITDLGILHHVGIGADGGVEVVILPTYSGCPAMSIIQIEVETALARAGFAHADVRLSHSPPWSTDRMTDEGREKLRAYGIAPPSRGGGKRALFAAGEEIACPRCGSPATERLSEFGSTACKALWRCTSCREPFDYFKCI